MHIQKQIVLFQSKHSGFPNRRQPDYIIWHAAIFVNYVYTVEVTQYFRLFGIAIFVTLPHSARE